MCEEKQRSEFASARGITANEAKRFVCTAEHKIARKDGGPSTAANVGAACHTCNSQRHHGRRLKSGPKSETAFRVFVQDHVAHGKWHPRHLHRLLLPNLAVAAE